MLKDSILKLLKLDTLVSNMTGFVEARMELVKLEIRQDINKALAKISILFFLAFAITLFLVFISIAVAFKIGESTGTFEGFSIVAAFYLVLALVLFFLRETIRTSIEKQLNKIISKQKD